MLKRLGPALVVVLLALPAGAWGSVTIGSPLTATPVGAASGCLNGPTPGCTDMLKLNGGNDQASPFDGVVVSWAVRASAPDSGVQLRIMHPVDTMGHFRPWTSGSPVNLLGTGAVERFAAGVPITKGDYIAVHGGDANIVPINDGVAHFGIDDNLLFNDPFPDRAAAKASDGGDSDGELLLQATVEPDVDGDGFGDDTQDACPNDAHDHAAPCGAMTIGPSVVPAQVGGTGCSMATCMFVNSAYPVPVSGVVVRYRLQASSSACCFAVRQVTITGADGVAGLATPDAAPDPGAGPTLVEGIRLPVTAGSFIGLRATLPAAIDEFAGSAPYDLFEPDPATGAGTPFLAIPGHTIDFNADVEPDADHDGYGDTTQDPCPLDAANHDHPCVADVKLIAPLNPGPLTMLPNQAATGLTVTNAGPADAAHTVVMLTAPAGAQLIGATSTAGSCTTATTVTCALGTMSAGASASIMVGVLASAPGTVTIAAHGSSDVSDPDLSSNDASLSVSFGPALGIGPPTAKPCSVAKRGTADGNTIQGTAFGDKISGLGGRDIIHGNVGDDCLYGGLGDDVLFGDAGNDKLYGQTGNDRLLGGDGDDTLSGSTGKDHVSGGAGSDRLSGGTGNDQLSGGPGKDKLNGGTGKDRLSGDAGNDTISARDHTRDVIDCGSGTDTATVDRVDRVKHCEHVHRR